MSNNGGKDRRVGKKAQGRVGSRVLRPRKEKQKIVFDYVEASPVIHHGLRCTIRMVYNKDKGIYMVIKKHGCKEWVLMPSYLFAMTEADIKAFKDKFIHSAKALYKKTKFKEGQLTELPVSALPHTK